MSAVETKEQRMLPTDRIAYSAIAERAKLELPGGARMAIWVIVNVEEWDPLDTMPRTAAGMFTVSYTCAVIIPTICGGLWDLTGKPWTVFVPLLICCVTLTVLGAIVVRFRPAAEKMDG